MIDACLLSVAGELFAVAERLLECGHVCRHENGSSSGVRSRQEPNVLAVAADWSAVANSEFLGVGGHLAG